MTARPLSFVRYIKANDHRGRAAPEVIRSQHSKVRVDASEVRGDKTILNVSKFLVSEELNTVNLI